MANNKKTYKIKCLNCGKSFIAYRPHAKFCCAACRAEHWRKEHPYIKPEELEEIKKKLGIK